MEDKKVSQEARVTPVEKSNFFTLLFAHIVIAVAITYVMITEYKNVYNFEEVITNNFVTMLTTILSIVTSVSVALFFAGKKFFRVLEVNSDYEGEIKEAPSEYPPAMVNFLFDGFTKTGVDVTTTILDLIRRGYIITEQDKNLDDVLNPDISVKLEKNMDAEELVLKKYEIDLLRMIFAEIGDGKNTSTRSIRLEMLNNPLYGPRIGKWQDIMLIELKEDNLIGEKSPKVLKRTIAAIATILVVLVFLDLPIEAVLIIYSLIQILLAKAIFSDTTLRYFTSKGSDMYSKWMAYRKYLMNAQISQEENLEKIKIYKLALGISVDNKVLFKVKEKFNKKLYEGL